MKFSNLRVFKTPIAITILFFSLIFAIYLFFTSQLGLQYTLDKARKFVPGQLTFGTISGSLSSPIILKNIHYQQDNLDMKVKQLNLTWQLSKLLIGKLMLDDLQLDQATVVITPTNSQTKQQEINIDLSFLKNVIINSVTLNTIQINYDKSSFSLNGKFANNWNFIWELSVADLREFLPQAQGSLLFHGKINGPREQPTFIVDLNNAKLNIADVVINISKGFIQAKQTSQGFFAQFAIHALPNISLTGQFSLPDKEGKLLIEPKQAVTGEAHLIVPQINSLQRFTDVLNKIQGRLRADLLVSGNIAKPQFNLDANLINGSIAVPEYGLKINNIQLRALSNLNQINWRGSLVSGQGRLQLNGNTDLTKVDLVTQLKLQGQNLTVSNTSNYFVVASPNLTINYQQKIVDINGDIAIPKAKLLLGADDQNIVELSNDVIFVDKKHKQSDFNIPFKAKIRLLLGEHIKIRYQGLKAKLRGNVTLIQKSAATDTYATGEIQLLNGRYDYLGQSLNLEPNSRLIFAGGPVDNPTLQVTASKKIKALPPNSSTNSFIGGIAAPPTWNEPIELIVGVRVQGMASKPEISLFSTPISLNQADILSMLLLGVPSNQISIGNAHLLFAAASGLGLGDSSGIKNLFDNFQQGIGLDELAIQSTPTLDPNNTNNLGQNTSLVLGKALSPKLYINYSIGIVQPINVFQINYIISKRWTLRSTSSSLANGIDLLYRIERGH